MLYPALSLRSQGRPGRPLSLYLSLSISQPPLFLAVALSIARMCCTQYYRRPPARQARQTSLSLSLSISISQPPLFLAVALSIARMCCTQYYRRPPARPARQTSISISQPPLFLAVALSIARMCCTQYYRRPPARQARQTSLSLSLSIYLYLTATTVSGCSIEYRKDVLYPVLQAAARKAGQADLYLSLSHSHHCFWL